VMDNIEANFTVRRVKHQNLANHKLTREGFLLARSFTSSALIVERLACLK
jgi:hypothetical protein